jgi:S1-C subfamily serine protease
MKVVDARVGEKVAKLEAELKARDKKIAELESKIKELAAGAPAKKEPVQLGVLVAEREGKLFVDEVEEGFTGSVAGLKKGDRLTHLNGKEYNNLDAIAAELKKINSGDQFTLTVARGEEVTVLTVVGASGKGGAKLVSQNVEKKAAAAAAKEEPKKEPAAKQPGFLGVEVVPNAAGAAVSNVIPGSAAATGGLKAGDVIKRVNGQGVNDVEGLKAILEKLYAGDKLELLVARDGNDVEVKPVILAPRAAAAAASGTAAAPAKTEEKPAAPRKRGVMGIVAGETQDNRVVVKSVAQGGAAEKAEVRQDDILLKINDKDIRSFDDLEAALAPLFAGDTVSVRIKRGGEEKELKLTLVEPSA